MISLQYEWQRYCQNRAAVWLGRAERAKARIAEKIRCHVVQIAPEDAHTMGDRAVEDARELDAASRQTRGRCG